jgi:hypothetical protein
MTEQLIARTVSGIYASKTKEKDIGEKSIVVLSTFFKMGGGERGCGNSQIDWKTLDFG